MALPPKDDPRRPLHLAIRSTRLLGVVLLVFGTCAFGPYMMAISRATRRGGPTGMPPAWTVLMVALIYFVPGAGFLILSIFLGRRQKWAVVSALVLSCLLGAFFLLAFAGFAIVVISGRQQFPGARDRHPRRPDRTVRLGDRAVDLSPVQVL
jgi:drug/metabolite transporter (DMT)-like permease